MSEGGLYDIARALREAAEAQASVEAEKLAFERAATGDRIELDRRALAIKYAQDEKTVDFRTDQNADDQPAHERVIQRARAYYRFLVEGPVTDE